MTLPSPLPIKPAPTARAKFTVVADERGEWLWAERPTPAQDAAWIAQQLEWRARSISFAKSLSKQSVQYFRWAGEETNPNRAAHYAAEGRRTRRKARGYLREARNRSV